MQNKRSIAMKAKLIKSGFVLAIVLPMVVVAADTPSTRPTYASADEVLAACQKAHHDGDTQAFIDCYSPHAQEHFVHLLLTMIAHSPTSSPSGQADPQKAVFEAKYGLDHRDKNPGETDAQLVDRLAGQIKDQRGFLIDFVSRQDAARPKDLPVQPTPELQNLQVSPDGKTAAGKLVRHEPDGSAMSQNAKFRKVDGSWLIDDIIFF
jgi:hypothetical protein